MASAPGATPAHPLLVTRDLRAIQGWLSLCLLLVVCMVFVGGYTRLTGSGLSITEWAPVHGTIPPLDAAQWQEEFDAYRASPQYAMVNKGMTLDEFKAIYWPEYWHRVLGRVIGFTFLLPLVVFVLRGSLTRRFGLRLTAIFALGGLQGLIGWLMVKSGLVEGPYVSHLKLALHLSMAFALFALILWARLDISRMARQQPYLPGLHRGFAVWFAALCVQIVLGAFMAGLHAGLVYNTWPTMNGQWLPDDLLATHPWFENITLIQFLHRKLAILLVAGFAFWWYRAHKNGISGCLGKLAAVIALVLGVQFALGVLTLVLHVPLWHALAHQLTGLALFAASVAMLWGLCAAGRRRDDDPVRIAV
jgi:cytochrome c oxidase assembly protein subunit 15